MNAGVQMAPEPVLTPVNLQSMMPRTPPGGLLQTSTLNPHTPAWSGLESSLQPAGGLPEAGLPTPGAFGAIGSGDALTAPHLAALQGTGAGRLGFQDGCALPVQA